MRFAARFISNVLTHLVLIKSLTLREGFVALEAICCILIEPRTIQKLKVHLTKSTKLLQVHKHPHKHVTMVTFPCSGRLA